MVRSQYCLKGAILFTNKSRNVIRNPPVMLNACAAMCHNDTAGFPAAVA